MGQLTGKVAYVTGAGAGIGAAIARRFAAEGARVALGDIRYKSVEETTAAIVADGGQALALAHDVSDEGQWVAALERTVATFGGLDILVNNAAIEQTCPLADVTADDVRRLLDVNVTGTILGHKHAIRLMRPSGAVGQGGSIVNLASVAGLIGTPALGVYSASKGAVRLLSKAAAVECGRFGYGIRVNAIFPGLVATEMGDKLVDDFVQLGVFPDREIADAQILASYPLGRTGQPQDIASAALFLASDQSGWMTGAELVVDGGLTVS
jgi:NAD(P)-dependent dehydrogenase (short-subunit alcohol dehydrogenase family)